MPLSYIINKICEKSGYSPTGDRDLLLSFINTAANEVYAFQDLPGTLMEAVFPTPPDSLIALPYFVGEVREMREYYSQTKIELKDMVPQYSYNSWGENTRVWRLIGKSPIQATITNAASLLVLSIPAVESEDIVVTITGKTTQSNRVGEVLTILAGETTVSATKAFTEIYSITKGATNTYDITITGEDSSNAALVLAVIPNDRLESLYTLCDVSAFPDSGEMGTAYRYIKVLFRKPLFTLTNDGDCFPANDFDDAVVYKTLEHLYSVQDGDDGKALGFYQKCNQFLMTMIAAKNGATQKELIFKPNQYLGLYPRYSMPRSNRFYNNLN